MKRFITFGLLVGIVATTGGASAGPPGPAELALGDWTGGAEAWGSGTADVNGRPLTWSGRFKSTFDFVVTESGVTGEFDLWTTGLLGGGSMTMDYETPEGKMHAEFNAAPGSGGSIVGERDAVRFHTRPMGTVGEVTFSAPEGSFSFPIAGDPSTVDILASIVHVACDQVIGNWDASISAQIEAAGWDASFKGYWAASPRLPDDQQTEMDQLIEGMDDLFADYADFDTSIGVGDSYDPLGADWGVLLDLVNRAVEISNRLHNLTECDRQAIGAETIQEWSTALAGLVGNLVIAASDFVAALDAGSGDVVFPFSQLQALIGAAGAVGAYGAGAAVDPGLAFQVESALIDLTSQSVATHLKVSRGELTPPDGTCGEACRHDHYLWAVGGVVEAVTHGWTITVEGQSYSPAESPDLLQSPPGGP